MTIPEWACVMGKLQDRDEERRQALKEMSDDDWCLDKRSPRRFPWKPLEAAKDSSLLRGEWFWISMEWKEIFQGELLRGIYRRHWGKPGVLPLRLCEGLRGYRKQGYCRVYRSLREAWEAVMLVWAREGS